MIFERSPRSPEDKREAREHAEFHLNALGSGSDYTPFLQYLGVASLDIRYGGEGVNDGVYHSLYDSFDHYTRFGDPSFDYGVALAQTAGRAVLRLANADTLPLEFRSFSETVAKYLKELMKLADDMREETKAKNRLIADKSFEAVFDPTKPFVAPEPEAPVPFFNFASLQNTLARLQENARNYERASSQMAASGKPLSIESQKKLDEILIQTEHNFAKTARVCVRYNKTDVGGDGADIRDVVADALQLQKNGAHYLSMERDLEIASRALERFSVELDKAVALLNQVRE